MNICIDISAIPYGTGVSRYTSNLTRALRQKMNGNNSLSVYGSSLRQYQVLRDAAHSMRIYDQHIYPLPPRISSYIWNKTDYPIDSLINSADIFHTWDWYLPAAKKTKVVITIHDLALFKYPDIAHPEIKAHHEIVMQRLKKFHTQVITISEATKQDLVNLFQIDPDDVTVIYEALPEELKIRASAGTIDRLIGKYNLHKQRILMVGTHEPRKNYKRQIEAWRKYKKDVDLIIVGKAGWEQIEPEEGLTQVGYATPEELAALYGISNCLLYCSLDEGFGLPILEAIYHHTPVITSNCSSMKEIAGNESGVELVDPKDLPQIQQAIEKVMKTPHYSDSIQSEKFLQRFSWEKAAAQTLEVYRKALS